MNELFQRNKPVFLIGLLTLGVFLFIILTAQLRPPTTPELIETDEQDLIAEHTNIKGPSDAKITIVEFTDYGCPACKAYHPTIKGLSETYPDQLRWAVRHFPLPQHVNADQAARAAQAAGNQGKFWEFSDILFENQDSFEEGNFVSYADVLGMDLEKIRQDYNDPGIMQQVQEDINFGKQIGINATPTFFMNGKQLQLNGPEDLRFQVEQALTDTGVETEEIKQQAVEEEEELEQEQLSAVHDLIDERYGVREIEYVDGNFKPRNTSAHAGQLVRWTNNSEESITFVQIMSRFPALNEPFVIEPGGSFEFRLELRQSGIWTYRDEGNPSRASIMIGPLTEDLEQMLPPQTQ